MMASINDHGLPSEPLIDTEKNFDLKEEAKYQHYSKQEIKIIDNWQLYWQEENHSQQRKQYYLTSPVITPSSIYTRNSKMLVGEVYFHMYSHMKYLDRFFKSRYNLAYLFLFIYLALTPVYCQGVSAISPKEKLIPNHVTDIGRSDWLISTFTLLNHTMMIGKNTVLDVQNVRIKQSKHTMEKYPLLFRFRKFNRRGHKTVKARPIEIAQATTETPRDSEINGMWAVKLKFDRDNDSREILDQSAETIAKQHGLENHGQIGELKGYYLFTKKQVSKTWTTMASAVVSSSQQEGSGRRSDGNTILSSNSNEFTTRQYIASLLHGVTEPMITTNGPVDKPFTSTMELPSSEYPDTDVLQQTSNQEELIRPTQSWNVGRGLRLHNQVEWQGHQVLLARSKRDYVPLEMKKDDLEIKPSASEKTKQENHTMRPTPVNGTTKQKVNTTVSPHTSKTLNVTTEHAHNVKPTKTNPSSDDEELKEEKERHRFLLKFVNLNSLPRTVTPQQIDVTHNQKYKDLVGGVASGGGIGGRRMGIDVDEEESAGDWWPLTDSNGRDVENGTMKTRAKFDDPLYGRQWHLENLASTTGNSDCNVTSVWEYGITGKGVVVAVVDDGVQWDHPDLIQNYCPEGSFDLNANDDDPMPVRDSKEENKHGTRCAGEIAAVPNNHCGVGVAHGARFSGIRILDGPLTDSMEAAAFNKHLDINDIYSCSWGPEDDGKTVDGPHPLAQAALKHGVVAGRRGFGSIYIVASGNGGHKGDNCNYDGYANSIYTITVGAVDEFGRVPSYAEECASMLACTFSSGAGTEDGNARKIVTTDWTLGKNKKRSSGCTESHTGTSAATPLAAGMVALMLQARPCLTWRDIQHIIVMTAIKIKPESGEWTTNTAGFHHSDKRGFGLLNAWRMVNAARVWRPVPWLSSLALECSDRRRIIPNTKKRALIVKTLVTDEKCQNNMIYTLEQVLVTVDIEHPRRGDLFISLVCPSGTTSVIGGPRKNDDSPNGLWNWTFATVKCWGERPHGTYRLIIHDTQDRPRPMTGELRSWKLTLYGSSLSQQDILEQSSRVEDAMSGKYLSPYKAELGTANTTTNDTDEEEVGYCAPLELQPYYSMSLLEKPTTERTLKLIALSGCFLLLWGMYCTMDVAMLQKTKLSANNNVASSSKMAKSLPTENTQKVYMNDLKNIIMKQKENNSSTTNNLFDYNLFENDSNIESLERDECDILIPNKACKQ